MVFVGCALVDVILLLLDSLSIVAALVVSTPASASTSRHYLISACTM